MKQISIIKWGKGYYVILDNGCNHRREWAKSKTAAEKLKKKWERE